MRWSEALVWSLLLLMSGTRRLSHTAQARGASFDLLASTSIECARHPLLTPNRLVERRRAALAVAAPTSRPLELKLGKKHPEERDAACYGQEYRRAETFGSQR